MTDKNLHSSQNESSRKELAEFITQLSDEQLTQIMPADWSVSAVLAHLAFWDLRALNLIKKWQSEGITPSAIDTDLVNEVSRPLLLAISPRKAVALVLSCAEEIDNAIDALNPGFLADVEENGKTVHLNRAQHRLMHLTEIKKELGLS